MTCPDHASPVDDCCGCAGRWDRAMAERSIETYDITGIARATLRMAIAEIDRLSAVVGVGDQLAGRLLAERDALIVARNADRTEWMTTYATMRAEIEALRCGDLDAFHDGELAPDRAERFRTHLATCEACQAGLQDLVVLAAIASAPPQEPWAPEQCIAAIACPREDCGAAIGERCKTDRPLHVERWDAWRAAGFPARSEA